jgi:GNAT superfamily N-acetyltransferase
MQIRRIDESEYEAASRIVLDCFAHSVAASMDAQGIAVFEEFAQAEAIRSRDALGAATYVAMEAGNTVGVLQGKDDGHIALLFVRPTRQRQGIGRKLICAADKTARLLTVNSSVNAVPSYESYGFCVCGAEQVVNGIRFVPMKRNEA